MAKKLKKQDYIVSFNVKVNFKNSGIMQELPVRSKLVQLEKDTSLDDVIDDLAQKYLNDLNGWYGDNAQLIDTYGVDVHEATDVDLLDLPMRHATLQYKLCPENAVINTNKGQCVLDYLMTEMCSVWSCYTRPELIAELNRPEAVISGYTIKDIFCWANLEQHRKYISVYALNPFNECIQQKTAEFPKLTLVFKINNDHCYGILSPELKRMVADTKKLSLKKQIFRYNRWQPSMVVKDSAAYLSACSSSSAAPVVYVADTMDLSMIAKNITMRSGLLLEHAEYRDAMLTSMVNPENGQVVIAAQGYEQRKLIADDLCAETRMLEFRFHNQSWAMLAKEMVCTKLGTWSESIYSPDLEDILDNYSLGPWIVQTGVDPQDDTCVAFDICRAYTHSILSNETPYNIFSIFDDAQPFNEEDELVAGEYCLDKTLWIANSTIRITQWQPLNMVRYLLQKKYIDRSNIKYVIRASRTLAHDVFKPVIEEMLTRWKEESKFLVNHWVGSLNKRVIKSNEVAMTDSWDVAMATFMSDPEHVQITHIDPIWLLRRQKEEKVTKGHSPIWRQIIAGGIIQLDQLHSAVCDEYSKVISYNTDAIVVVDPRPQFTPQDKKKALHGDICKEALKPLRGYSLAKLEEPAPYKYDPKEWNKVTREDVMNTGGGVCVTGMPGCGKTQLLWDITEDDKENALKVVSLAKTNCAVANMVNRGVNNCFTLDFYFLQNDRAGWKNKLATQNVVNLEEFSMVNRQWFETLYAFWKEQKFQFRMYGDPNQCIPIEDDKQWYNYLKSKAVRLMCEQKMCKLAYIAECGRYDDETREVLEALLETGELTKHNNHFTSLQCDYNIVATHEKRIRLNQQWFDALSVGKEIHEFGKLRVYEGMPVISNVNLKQLLIYNSERYYVKTIRANDVVLELDDKQRTIPVREMKHFDMGFAETVQRLQGVTLKKPFNIHETEKMSLNNVYTAISRTTLFSHVGIQKTCKRFMLARHKLHGSAAEVKAAKIADGGIYRMSDDEGWYVGRSNDPERREQEHYNSANEPEKMKEWLKKGRKKFEILDSFRYRDHGEDTEIFKSIEEYYIKAEPNREKSKNTQHIAVVEEKITEVKIDYERFKINDGKRGYSIQWRENGTKRTKEFAYQHLQKAQDFQKDLIKRLYR